MQKKGLIKEKKTIAFAGNPNVGKSTLFNALTGMHQHTGNWTGKTVGLAVGESEKYRFVDLPGTYSLLAHSEEEAVARDFLLFQKPDAVVVVADATCLLRNLNLVIQTAELCPRVILCVNLMDEAKKKGITLDLGAISCRLGISVVGLSARKKNAAKLLTGALDTLFSKSEESYTHRIVYPSAIEEAINLVEPTVARLMKETSGQEGTPVSRFIAARLLEGDESLYSSLAERFGTDFFLDTDLCDALEVAQQVLESHAIGRAEFADMTVSSIVREAEEVVKGAVLCPESSGDRDRRMDAFLTGKVWGFLSMLALLALVFWLTVVGANYFSSFLSDLLFRLEDYLFRGLKALSLPLPLRDFLIFGCYRVTAWIVSVMLPPMAIFFPLFTLLEDAGYLPRIAYNLDAPFRCCHACGKQALTMCMGFGCNAVGVTGCRIIDSPRERLLAILTNQFVPCNGRFPALVAVLTMFCAVGIDGAAGSFVVALMLAGLIVGGILLTFLTTRFLSATFLRGAPSSFVLELPPYRRPEIGRVIVRSVFDRTVFVLGRAVAVAVPAGALLFLLANLTVGGESLLAYAANALEPFGRLMGVDGVILLAFILGAPANEIVLPIMIMAYTAEGKLASLGGTEEMHALLTAAGWTWQTAISVLVLFICHFPCTTTLLTIKKETGSWKWTALAAALPTVVGIMICMALTALFRAV